MRMAAISGLPRDARTPSAHDMHVRWQVYCIYLDIYIYIYNIGKSSVTILGIASSPPPTSIPMISF